MGTPLAPELLQRIHAYWRAANYLSVGQIYLMDNPLLTEPLVALPSCLGVQREPDTRFKEVVDAWVDMARLYTILGQLEKARRAIDNARAIAPEDRFVLRSSARFFVTFPLLFSEA